MHSHFDHFIATTAPAKPGLFSVAVWTRLTLYGRILLAALTLNGLPIQGQPKI